MKLACLLTMPAIVSFLLACAASNAQAPNWQWAKFAVNIGSSSMNIVKTDGVGNIYTLGMYTGLLSFGDTSCTSQGSQSIYLTKYTPTGQLLWLKNISIDLGTIEGNAMAVDDNGD